MTLLWRRWVLRRRKKVWRYKWHCCIAICVGLVPTADKKDFDTVSIAKRVCENTPIR